MSTGLLFYFSTALFAAVRRSDKTPVELFVRLCRQPNGYSPITGGNVTVYLGRTLETIKISKDLPDGVNYN